MPASCDCSPVSSVARDGEHSGRHVEVRQPQSLGRQSIDVRCVDLRPEAAEVGEPHVVAKDHDDVGRVLRWCGSRWPPGLRLGHRATDGTLEPGVGLRGTSRWKVAPEPVARSSAMHCSRVRTWRERYLTGRQICEAVRARTVARLERCLVLACIRRGPRPRRRRSHRRACRPAWSSASGASSVSSASAATMGSIEENTPRTKVACWWMTSRTAGRAFGQRVLDLFEDGVDDLLRGVQHVTREPRDRAGSSLQQTRSPAW
jgi:hypothetical protein